VEWRAGEGKEGVRKESQGKGREMEGNGREDRASLTATALGLAKSRPVLIIQEAQLPQRNSASASQCACLPRLAN